MGLDLYLDMRYDMIEDRQNKTPSLLQQEGAELQLTS